MSTRTPVWAELFLMSQTSATHHELPTRAGASIRRLDDEGGYVSRLRTPRQFGRQCHNALVDGNDVAVEVFLPTGLWNILTTGCVRAIICCSAVVNTFKQPGTPLGITWLPSPNFATCGIEG